jgi:ATP-dependent helicase HrpA
LVAKKASSYLFYRMESANAHNPPLLAFLDALRNSLTPLVPKNFIALYDAQRLQRLVRYMQALTLRAQRGLVDLEKEGAKAALVAPFQKRLTALVDGLTPQTSPQRRHAIEAFLWMLEEFKISVFAQEIKTAHPISAKRLEKQLEKIDAMV